MKIADQITLDGGVEVGGVFSRRVLLRVAAIGLVAFFVVGLLAPWALILDQPTGLSDIWRLCLMAGFASVSLAVVLALPRMRFARRVLRDLAFEPERVGPEDVGGLADLPFTLSIRFVIAGGLGAAAMTIPGIVPSRLDQARAVSLALLTFTIIAASAVVQYVAVRDATIRAIELCPLEPISAWLEREAMRLGPRQRVSRKILLAVLAPVALVGVGAVLVGQAHQRAFVEASRAEIARELAAIAVGPVPGETGDAGRDDALAAAAAHGFFIRQPREEAPSTGRTERLRGGQMLVTLPEAEGGATVRFTAELAPEVVTTGAWLALLAGLVAAIAGGIFGRMLAIDLALATQQVSSLGTESVLRGHARVAGPARFRVVADLGRSVEALADRFRVFAAAQERALEARASAQRIKQLLFASVSHDLKSPLNAVLGFAELVRGERLNRAQLESLDMVTGRGRELLALIETILDAARVEAGQLELAPTAERPAALVRQAVTKARDLHGPQPVEVVVEVSADLPRVLVDPTYVGRAVAVLIAHAMDAALGGHMRRVRVRAGVEMSASDEGRDGKPSLVKILIEYVPTSNTPSLLEAQLRGRLHKQTGRGKVLRLSLARAIIELHHGRVEVGRGPRGAAIVTCWLPVAEGDAETTLAVGTGAARDAEEVTRRRPPRPVEPPTVRIIDSTADDDQTLVFRRPR
ncbi:MAG: histidine kinase dimerization/phospho-acceptor domain-containing protein [Polyangiaceae bacterium]